MLAKSHSGSYTGNKGQMQKAERKEYRKMNPSSIMKAMSAKAQFEKNHPKFTAFLRKVFSRPLEEGTVIEVTVTRPGEEPVTANIRVQQSDLELLSEMRELGR